MCGGPANEVPQRICGKAFAREDNLLKSHSLGVEGLGLGSRVLGFSREGVPKPQLVWSLEIQVRLGLRVEVVLILGTPKAH